MKKNNKGRKKYTQTIVLNKFASDANEKITKTIVQERY